MSQVCRRIMEKRDFGHDLRRSVQQILCHGSRAALASSATALLLTAVETKAQQVSTSAGGSGQESGALAEIVVTAQKRTQSLQDVPYNISAITGDVLHDSGVVSINNLTEVVPGLMNVDQGPADRGGNNNFVLRGLRTDAPGGGVGGAAYQNLTVSPVSTYYGETPVFFQVPIDDLERVEVLRGPQGTLYGSGSQAGTIRFVPKKPDFKRFSGDVRVEGSYTDYSPSGNGSIHGVLNIPLADHLALRVVAGEDHLGGFIKAVDRIQGEPNGTPVPSVPGNPASGFVLGPVQEGTNSSDQYFARVAVRWQPTDAVDIQLEGLHQHTFMADSQLGSRWAGGPFDSSYGAYPATSTVDTRPGCTVCSTSWLPEPFTDSINMADLVTSVDVGLATITSASSFYNDESVTSFDQTGLYYGIANPPNPNASPFLPFYPYSNYPRLIAGSSVPAGNRAFVQELRLVSKPGKIFDYVVGLYYQRQTQTVDFTQANPGLKNFDAFIGQPNPSTYGDIVYVFHRNTTFYDKAAFGELTYHPTNAWQITGGVRAFRQPFSSNILSRNPLCGAICAGNQVEPSGLNVYDNSTTFSNHIWKLNSSYDFSANLKVYATFSEGFRRGGVSGLTLAGPFASPADLQTFKPDLAKNYELGVKGSLFERRLTYFADIYLVNLYDFQFDSPNLSGNIGAFNGKNARSQGLEFESQFALTDRLTGGLGYAFTRSYVTKSFDVLDYPPYALIPSAGGTGDTTSLFGGPIAAGTKLPGVSPHVVNASANYKIPAATLGSNGSWAWHIHLDASYRSSQNSNINPNSAYEFVIPSSVIVNGLVAMEWENGARIDLFVRNLTNNPGISGGEFIQKFLTPYSMRDVGTPRTVGFGVQYHF